MNSRRIALWAATAAAVSWTVKSVAIGAAGGLDKSPFEAPLYFAGLLAFVVAVVCLGVAATDGARTWMRALAGVGAFVAGLALAAAIDALVGTFQPAGDGRHWAWTELNLWVLSLAGVTLALRVNRPQTDTTRPMAVTPAR